MVAYGFDGTVANVGSRITVSRQTIYEQSITNQELDALWGILHRSGVFYSLETSGGAFGDDPWVNILEDDSGEDSAFMQRVLLETVKFYPITAYSGESVYKIIFLCQDKHQMDEVTTLFGETYSVCL